jgi:hypothetical protein
MIAMQYIVAFAMGVVNVFKAHIPSKAVPFVTMGLTIIFNLVNSYLYGEGNLLMAGKDAFIAGGIAVGMFAAGDAIRKSEHTPFKTQR